MKRHALFVGVDQYADGHIPNLSCAVSDATDLHGFFKYGAGYDQVQLLPNPAGKKEILGAVRELTSGLGQGDFFLFFFAGHGFRVGENHVLVCAKDLYDDVKYEYDGLPLGQLKHRLSGAFDSALLLDACQSDILATRGGEGIAERDLSLIHEVPTGRPGGGALTIVTSCDAGQTAAELSEKRHGLFTVAMLDLLKEAQQAHTRLDLSDAFRLSLGQRMGEIAARFGLPTEQRPRFSCTGDTCFVLLDGIASASGASPSVAQFSEPPALVLCPVCGFRNREEQTFRCQICKRDYLCKSHYDEDEKCCEDCAAAKRKERAERDAAERKAREKAKRKERAGRAKAGRKETREEALQNGTCLETGICRTIILPGGAEMEMIYCPPGEFMMGSPEDESGRADDEALHHVKLTRGFWLGKYPVTQDQWKDVMGTNPSRFKKLLIFKDGARPVESVSWNDCQSFVKEVNAKSDYGARLPTEAEWEYACRAGTTTPFSWGKSLNGNNANCNGHEPYGTARKGQSLGKTTPVGEYKANSWGFCDMHGNVDEWCNDRYGNYPSGTVRDPKGPATGRCRVLRGGSWVDDARDCRSAFRNRESPDGIFCNYGFRLCCSAGLRG